MYLLSQRRKDDKTTKVINMIQRDGNEFKKQLTNNITQIMKQMKIGI